MTPGPWGYDDKLIEWYEGYQKRKAQKAQIKKELMPIAWHPSRWWDWCVPEDEKKETVTMWAKILAFLCLVTGHKNFLTKKNCK